jgi:predicted RNase H-like HicB family nuclease
MIGQRNGDTMEHYRLTVIVEKDTEGYIALCPELQGCYAQGETYEEVMANLRDVVELHIQDRISIGEKIETFEMISLTSLEVTV